MHSTSIGHGSDWNTGNPFMVVERGESLAGAIERHRRHTGHTGDLIVTAFNRSPRAGHSMGAAA